MNKILIIVFTAFTVANLSFTTSQKGVVVKGKIDDLAAGTRISLLTVNSNAQAIDQFELTDTLFSVCTQDGSFDFKYELLNNGQLFMIGIDGIEEKMLLLLSEGDRVKVNGKMSNWPTVSIKGSATTTEWYRYKKGFDELFLQRKAKESAEYRKQYLATHKNSICASFIIMKSNGLSLDERKAFYSKLTPEIKSSYWGKMAPKFFEDMDRRELIDKNLAEGKIIPDFDAVNEKGEKLTLHALISQSKYTLIDFWASWCAPCLESFPKMKEIYNKYHSLGFNIISVSRDSDAQAWKKMLKKVELPWFNLLDNIENAGKNKFAIAGIPSYLLVDQQGEILKVDYIKFSNGKFQLFENGGLGKNDLQETVEKLFK